MSTILGKRGLLAAIGAAAVALFSSIPAEAQTRPNIVFVLADDMEAGLAGNPAMPTLAGLAKSATTFNRAYTTVPICVPSRASILTGRYAQNTNTRSNRPPSGGYENFAAAGNESRTFAVWLDQAGYYTAHIGKYLNYYPLAADPAHVPPGWDFWATPNQSYVHAKTRCQVIREDGRTEYCNRASGTYTTDEYARYAREAITAAGDAPFAVVLSIPSPHSPYDPAPRHASLFPTTQTPRTPAFNEADVSDKPPFISKLPLLSGTQIGTIDAMQRDRLRMLRSVDEAIKSVRSHLQSLGKLQNTYFVFTADHGWHMGQHRQMPMKGRPYETDIRVPLVVDGPGVPTRTVSRVVTLADLAPTFAAWAGAAAPGVDGRSFAGLLKSANPAGAPWRKRVPFQRMIEGRATLAASGWPDTTPRPKPANGGPYSCMAHLPDRNLAWPRFRGIRTERYTYVEHETGDVEFYDNVSDPYQLANLACTRQDLRPAMMQTVRTLYTCAGDGCRAEEDR